MSPAASARGSWQCGSHALSLDVPLVMGIVNVTPDSFSDGGLHGDPASAVAWGERLLAEGARIVDVGGESTRPGAAEISGAEELARVRPVIKRLAAEGSPVSIDTRHPEIASACVDAGASIVNDVSGFRDPEMVELAASCDAGLVVMHMLGDPATMQRAPRYDNVAREVGGFLLAQAAVLQEAGVAAERIVLDPGIGFGKTLEHNISLLRAIPELAVYGFPILIGASRKRFIGELSGEAEPRERLGGSIAAALEAVHRGASIVRVHDVAATVQALAVSAAVNAE